MITCVMVLKSDICRVILLQSQVKSRAIALGLTFDWRRNYSSNDPVMIISCFCARLSLLDHYWENVRFAHHYPTELNRFKLTCNRNIGERYLAQIRNIPLKIVNALQVSLKY